MEGDYSSDIKKVGNKKYKFLKHFYTGEETISLSDNDLRIIRAMAEDENLHIDENVENENKKKTLDEISHDLYKFSKGLKMWIVCSEFYQQVERFKNEYNISDIEKKDEGIGFWINNGRYKYVDVSIDFEHGIHEILSFPEPYELNENDRKMYENAKSFVIQYMHQLQAPIDLELKTIKDKGYIAEKGQCGIEIFTDDFQIFLPHDGELKDVELKWLSRNDYFITGYRELVEMSGKISSKYHELMELKRQRNKLDGIIDVVE